MGPDIQKILVPIDFSDYSKSALKYAVNFCKNCKAEMILIYVVEPVIYPPDFSMGQIAIPSINAEWDERARQKPCPTLIIVIGFVLMLDNLGSEKLNLMLGASGLLYGILGVAYLHMTLD